MKKLLLAALLLTSTAFARGVPLPTCTTQGTEQVVQYKNFIHFYLDFCQNDRGIHTVEECKSYFRNSDQQLLQKELQVFFEKRAEKVCGK